MQASLESRCAGIELLVLDVDGVLTDGGIVLDDNALESKRFHVRDGAGIAYWRRAGKRVAILSGRHCKAVEHRAAELGIDQVLQGRLDKRPALEELLAGQGLRAGQACFVGDDLADIPALRAVGLAVAVANATPEARTVAHFVTSVPGGSGAVREVVELLMRAQGLWDSLLQHYQGS